jgi:predicted transposase YbfD/YdcC
MEGPATSLVLRLFNELPDPRARNVSHLLSDVVTIAILATLCGSQGWEEIAEWGQVHEPWLGTFLTLRAGVPSHDTIDDVFKRIDPAAFEQCFQTWTGTLVEASRERGKAGRFVAIDGKTLRRSFDHAWSRTPIHMVSAFLAQNQLVLGQIKVDSKENEIVAIPKLLELLDLRRTTVTIDAIGCQKEIAAKIRERKGHYVLALKENQKLLHAAVQKTFAEAQLEKFAGWKHDSVQSIAAGHGRIETRRVWVTSEIKHIKEIKDWTDLRGIVLVESIRDVAGQGATTEKRYYITSHRKLDATMLADAIRSHWKIENQQHHVLDTTMHEDDSRIRKGNGPENFARLRRIALNQLRKVKVMRKGKEKKLSLRMKQKRCSWDPNLLLSALLA